MKQLFLPKLLGVGAALLLAASLISFPAQAQTTVDVACNTAALRTAINTANGTPQVDTLNLAAACAYNFTAGDATDPDTALPGITTPIIVNGNDATIARTDGSPDFRLLYVTSTGNLTLDNATVTGGIANVSGGGIRNSGTLTVTNSTLSGNSAVYGGGIYNNDTLTVTNSTFSGNSAANFGGGIYNNGGTLTVTNSTFSGNSAENVGGGIANGGTLTVTSSTFSGNSAGFYGGGIYNDGDTATVTDSTLSTNSAVHDGGGINNGGTLTVTNSTISTNSAEDAGGGIANAGTLTVTNSPLSGNTANNGGGIANVGSGGTLTVTGSTLSGNSADASGGGIYNVDLSTVTVTNSVLSGNSAASGGSGGGIDNGGTLTVTNSTLSGNSAGYGGGIANFGGTTVTNSTLSTNSASYGGGIQNQSGTLTVTNSILSGNSADFGGGIFNDSSGLVFVDNSTLSGNSADFGGGIFNDSTLTVTNSIVSGNSAEYGGGIYNNGTLTVSSSTLSDNNGSTDGGGIYNESGTPTVTNSIVWGNSTQIFVWGGMVTVTFSDIQDGFEGEGNLSYDPLFTGAVSYTSAPTSTGDYHLQSGSPAINAGSNAALPAGLFDRDGNARVSGFTVDMGAYEVQLIDLLDNGGFETAGATNAVPASWSVKNTTSDKRLCKIGKPRTGLCAFRFAGSIGENAQLSQTVDLTGVTLTTGDTLTLSAFFKGNSPTAKTRFILIVSYAGGPVPVKSTVTVKQNAAYTQVTLPVMTLGAGTVEAIKVAFKHKSTSGKVLVDDASLIHTPGGARSRSDTLPPPPSMPNGFRGGN